MDRITSLSTLIATLPGLGPKSARRIVNKLLLMNDEFVTTLSNEIAFLKKYVHHCPVCGGWTESEKCNICSSTNRDKQLLCIVEQTDDITAIEDAKVFNGVYHVLNGVISPVDGVYPENLRFKELLNRLDENTITEVIIATNPTDEGDTTAIYTKSLINKKNPNIKVTRLSQGIQSGGDLEFANIRAITQSFINRHGI